MLRSGDGRGHGQRSGAQSAAGDRRSERTWFDADVRLPAGATLTGAAIYLNPNGASRACQLGRYSYPPPVFENLVEAGSTNGVSVERVDLAINHLIDASWDYRLGQVRLDVGGAILYGGEITYTIPPTPAPPAPSGLFVPFAGSQPRVYDTRNGLSPLAHNEERVVPLGVAGTVKAAVFNLTISQTQGAGYVACFRADTAWPGNSSINWYEAGADVANMVICAADNAGQIRIRGGNNTTHVIIDLIGTFV